MIELPEAVAIAEQFNEHVRGKRIARAARGNAPHKFAFYSRPAEEYAAILPGKKIGESRAQGSLILVDVDPAYLLVFGGGGERIRLHAPGEAPPKKHQLLVEFEDGTRLSVCVQGWGSVKLLERARERNQIGYDSARLRNDPLSKEFTFAFFGGLCDGLPEGDPASAKLFLITRPGILGIGNGYTQDILLHAGLHPRTRVKSLDARERPSFHNAIRKVMADATKKGGRDDEYGLFGQAGRYHRLLDAEAAGKPCPQCGTKVTKFAFLGGACYVCPKCQP